MITQSSSKIQGLNPEVLDSAMSRPIIKHPHWVNGIWAPGVTILAGAPKSKKSFLALEMSLCVTSSIPFADTYPVTSSSILYLHLDSDPSEVPERIHDTLNYHSWDYSKIFLQYNCPPGNPGLNLIYEYLKSHPDIKLLVIDTLGWIQPKTGQGGNLYLQDYQFMGAFKTLYSELGVSSLLLHHTRKMEALSFLDEVSGSRGMTGGAHNVLVLSKNGAIHTLKGTGSKLKDDIELHFKFQDRFLLTTENLTIKEQILLLLENGSKHYKDIAIQLNRTPNVILVTLSQMDTVQKLGGGVYQLRN